MGGSLQILLDFVWTSAILATVAFSLGLILGELKIVNVAQGDLMMVGRGDLSLPQASGQSPVREEDVWLVGARDLDPLEAVALDGSQVNRAAMGDLETLHFDRPVHLHVDIDVIDAAEVPANNYPVPGGPTLAETIRACTHFAAANRLFAISVSGWSGALDPDGRTARATAALLAAIEESLF